MKVKIIRRRKRFRRKRKIRLKCRINIGEKLKNLRPMDDIFITEILRDDVELAEKIIRILIGRKDLSVVYQESEFVQDNCPTPLALLAIAEDEKGKLYCVKIKGVSSENIANLCEKYTEVSDEGTGDDDDYKPFPVMCLILFLESDIFMENEPTYQFCNQPHETNIPFDGIVLTIYVNGSYNGTKDYSELANLIYDMRSADVNDIFSKGLAEKVRYLKCSPEGIKQMREKLTKSIKEDHDDDLPF